MRACACVCVLLCVCVCACMLHWKHSLKCIVYIVKAIPQWPSLVLLISFALPCACIRTQTYMWMSVLFFTLLLFLLLWASINNVSLFQCVYWFQIYVNTYNTFSLSHFLCRRRRLIHIQIQNIRILHNQKRMLLPLSRSHSICLPPYLIFFLTLAKAKEFLPEYCLYVRHTLPLKRSWTKKDLMRKDKFRNHIHCWSGEIHTHREIERETERDT